MGGIGLSCEQPQPNTTHTYAHTQDNKIHTYEIIHLQTYICTDNNKTICSTQFAHRTHTHKHTEKTKIYAAHTPQHQVQHRIEHKHSTQHAHNLHTHRTNTISGHRTDTTSTQVHYIRFAQI